ncbi:hypothetical protein BB561_000637 [Smittium simulii]|uniref:serine C-palmitoyltransferase n=1 Tax=Smittium simulii TaxID=133385 RepID=A0A2T9YYC1_9FUNG|nr:hypothetical protein BB561_000637 [Smittium simulii]
MLENPVSETFLLESFIDSPALNSKLEVEAALKQLPAVSAKSLHLSQTAFKQFNISTEKNYKNAPIATLNPSKPLKAETESLLKCATAVLPEEKKQVSELEQVPIQTLISTYFSFMILLIFAHVRDLLGKFFYPDQYKSLKEQDGYAPLISDFESLWNRRLYTRISDVFNRPITGVAGGHVNLLERTSKDNNRTFQLTGKKTNVLNLASYNYLGFAQSQGYCADQVEKMILEHGISTCTSRLHGGHTSLLSQTEQLVANFVGTEDAIIISMGYSTNSSVLPLLVQKGCLLISDELNHSSLVAGSRLSGATIAVFKHNNPEDLEQVLRKSISQGQPRTHRPWKKILVVVEGLYSMEGELCNLRGIIALKQKYKFNLYVDEAHSIGAVGKRGRGICDLLNIDPKQVDILMGTFTKSFGAVGGYIAGNKSLISMLRLMAHTSVYAESMPIPVLEQVASSLRLIMDDVPECKGEGLARINQLADNSAYFMGKLKQMGFLVLGSKGSPVVPLLLFNPGKIPAFSHECTKRNMAVVVVSYPATPIISGRVRFCLSASHTREDLNLALKHIDEIGDLLQLKLLKK